MKFVRFCDGMLSDPIYNVTVTVIGRFPTYFINLFTISFASAAPVLDFRYTLLHFPYRELSLNHHLLDFKCFRICFYPHVDFILGFQINPVVSCWCSGFDSAVLVE